MGWVVGGWIGRQSGRVISPSPLFVPILFGRLSHIVAVHCALSRLHSGKSIAFWYAHPSTTIVSSHIRYVILFLIYRLLTSLGPCPAYNVNRSSYSVHHQDGVGCGSYTAEPPSPYPYVVALTRVRPC